MKKLMFIAAVALAIGAQASSYTWKAATSYIYTAGDSATKLASGTAYLFDAGTYSQSTLLAAVLGGSDLASIYSANGITAAPAGTVSSGQVSQSAAFTYNGVAAGDTLTTYFAILSGDNLYISSTKDVQASALDTAVPIAFASQKTASQAAIITTGSFSGAGWYAAAVPEPTSGLLMLVGLGALALRRRRA